MKRKNALSVVLIVLIMIYLLIPLAACVIYSFFAKWTDIVPRGFTLSAYQELFANTAFWSALGQTMLLSIAPIAITMPTRIASFLRLMGVSFIVRPARSVRLRPGPSVRGRR